jgi:hypothetical protein
MGSNELLQICGIAFLMVFVILTVLASVMRLIIVIFPEKLAETDAATIAGITAAVQTVFPGTKVTSIEEKK